MAQQLAQKTAHIHDVSVSVVLLSFFMYPHIRPHDTNATPHTTTTHPIQIFQQRVAQTVQRPPLDPIDAEMERRPGHGPAGQLGVV